MSAHPRQIARLMHRDVDDIFCAPLGEPSRCADSYLHIERTVTNAPLPWTRLRRLGGWRCTRGSSPVPGARMSTRSPVPTRAAVARDRDRLFVSCQAILAERVS